MTIEEYKVQEALGLLSRADTLEIARDETTPTETLQYILDIQKTEQRQWWWIICGEVNTNLDKRGLH